MKIRRQLRDLKLAVRHQWWIATGERQRVMEERDRYRAWGEQQFKMARDAEHAVYMLKASNVVCSIDTLRRIADQIDCEPGCETVGPMDWSTGVSECPALDRGECPFADASELRDLAFALETNATLSSGSAR